MKFWISGLALGILSLSFVASAAAQEESKAAQATRKKLAMKITMDLKETGIKAWTEEIARELDMPLKFFIDAASGVSNNTKLSAKVSKGTVESLLNKLADAGDFGWYVESNAAKNTVDGRIVFRKNTKGKERGYELGKEPKK